MSQCRLMVIRGMTKREQVLILQERNRSLEKLLQLELASADLMDECMVDWAHSMRRMARHNVAMTTALGEILFFCEQCGFNLGPLRSKAEALLDFSEIEESADGTPTPKD